MKKEGIGILIFIFAIFIFLFSFFPLASSSDPGDISTCQTLDTPGVYTLTTDLSGADIPEAGCFIITNMDVELNCQNHFIGNETSAGYGIFSDEVTNTTVKNCRVSFPLGYGAYFNISNGGQIVNSSFNFSVYGIYFFQSNNTVSNVTLYGNTYGIYLNDTDNVLTDNLNIESNTNGVYLLNSNSNSFSDVNASVNFRGAYFESSSNNNISGSSFSLGGTGPGVTIYFGTGNQILDSTVSDYIGITLDSDTSTVISNVTLFNNYGGHGLKLLNSSNDLVVDLNSSFNTYGIWLESSSNNRIINSSSKNNSLYLGTGGYGLFVDGGANNTFSGNAINYNAAEGILLSYSSNNSLSNNSITGNNDYNFYLLGNSSDTFNQTISADNLLESKPLYYNFSISDYVYDETTAPNAATVYCAFCDNITVKNLNITNSYGGVLGGSYVFEGIVFYNTTNSLIQNITSAFNLYGVQLSYSSNTNITNVSLSKNFAGLYAVNSSNIRIINATSFNNSRGIYELYSNLVSIINSSTGNNTYGVSIERSNNSNVSGTTLGSNSQYGFYMWYNQNLTLSNNSADQNDVDFFIYGSSATEYNHTISVDNLLEGKSLYYNFSISNYVYDETTAPNAATVYCINCSNVTVENLNLTDSEIYYGIYLWYPKNSTIQNVSVSGKNTGIYVWYGLGDEILNSTFNNNTGTGVNLQYSNYSNLTNVNANNNTYGIYLMRGLGAIFNNCTANNNQNTSSFNGRGIYFYTSSQNQVINCTASGNKIGIDFEQTSANNTVTGVTANMNSNSGIYISTSSSNMTIFNTTTNNNIYGVYLSSASVNNITNSTIGSNSLYGVYLSSSNNNSVMSNTVNSNVYGAYLLSSNNNNVTSNIILNSTTNATYIDGSSTGNNISGNTIPVVVGEEVEEVVVNLGGGGGGGGAGGSTSYFINSSQLANGYTKSLMVNYQLNFSINNENHSLVINIVNSSGAKVTVSSVEQSNFIGIGDSWKVDVDKDGKRNELYIYVESVTNNFVKIMVRSIDEEISKSSDGQTTVESVTNSEVKESISAKEKSPFSNNFLIIFGIIFLVIIIVVIAIVVSSRKKKY